MAVCIVLVGLGESACGAFAGANPSMTANTPAKGVTLAGEKMAARA